ncbi:hypothetical protein CRG98_017349 [Punica granatum]|uniref:Uncharacterized protein n=1 Tax=Punica granatum TaxID=22663 RepID=A0A2I0K131_PUNGR|nr:hypothetical protein CRG98_017349 [Punica granatum]
MHTLFYASQFRRASLLARASSKSVEPARPCTLSFTHPKFAEPARSCFLQICQACSPVHTLLYASQFRGACSLVLLANLPGLLARAYSLLRFASSPSLLIRAFSTSVGPARPCTLSFTLRNFAERACSLVLLPNLSNLLARLLARAHSPLRFAISRSLLACASCKSTGPARPCLLSFTLRKFAEPPHSCFFHICRACTTMHTLFYASQFRRASLLARASSKSVEPARPCTLSFTHPKFAEPARSCFLQICQACSPVHTLLYASQFRGACSLVLLANLPGLLARAYSLLRFASSPSLLIRAFSTSVGPARPCTLSFTLRNFAERACSLVLLPNLSNLLARAHSLLRILSSPSLLARASCKSVRPARPCTLSFTLRNFAEPARLCFLQIYRACSPVPTLFYASQVRRASSFVLFPHLSGLHDHAHSLLRFAISPSEPARSCFFQICRTCSPACSPVHTLLYASQFRGACSLVLLANLPGLLARAYSLLRFASSPSLLIRAFSTSVGPARPCTLSFTLRNFAERACSLVLLPNLSNLLARAHSLLCFAILPSLLARASCKSVGTARPCTLSFVLHKFAEPSHSCFLHICRTCSTVHTLFYASQFRGACSLVLLANLPSLLNSAHSLLRFVSSPSLLARASCKSVRPARPCTLSFVLHKFAEPSHSCFLHICRTCSTVHTLFYASQFRRASLLARASSKYVEPTRPCTLYFKLRKFAEPLRSCISQICRAAPPCTLFYASQVRRACSLLLSANLPGLLAHAHSLFRFAISPSLLTCASCKSAGTSPPCTLSFMLRKFAEPSHSCCLPICRACSPVHTLLYASQFCGTCSLVLLANLPGLLVHAHSLLRFASSPSLLARASCKSVGLARPCTLSFMLRNFAEPARSCFLQICRACSPVHTLLYASQFCGTCSLVLLANLPGLLVHAHSLLRFAISPSLLARASCKSVGLARPCTLSFTLRNFAEPAR